MTLAQHFRRSAVLAMMILALGASRRASAHGETLIRIAAVTQQIQSATTNVAQLYLLRGDLHREHQDWIAAEADYLHAGQLNPELPTVNLCQARLRSDTGDWNAAEALFTKVLARSPREGEAFIGRARVRLKLKNSQEALQDFQRGLETLSAPQPEYFMEFASALVADARSADALRALDDGIKRVGPLVSLQSYALQLELEMKNLDAALRRVDSILMVAPRKENWHAQRGDILLLAQRPTEAQRSYTAALRAVDALPARLQQSPAMVELVSRVRAALTKIAARPVVSID